MRHNVIEIAGNNHGLDPDRLSERVEEVFAFGKSITKSTILLSDNIPLVVGLPYYTKCLNCGATANDTAFDIYARVIELSQSKLTFETAAKCDCCDKLYYSKQVFNALGDGIVNVTTLDKSGWSSRKLDFSPTIKDALLGLWFTVKLAFKRGYNKTNNK